jgi:hypothetical protein
MRVKTSAAFLFRGGDDLTLNLGQRLRQPERALRRLAVDQRAASAPSVVGSRQKAVFSRHYRSVRVRKRPP